MTDAVAELNAILASDDMSDWVVGLWTKFKDQRKEREERWLELRKYIVAIDTTKTANSSLPWKHTTTTPKLTQIRDNLHTNYMGALFPNDKWLKWQAYTREDSSKQKAQTITAYMENKTRLGGYKQVISECLYDYIDYGRAFITASFESRYKTINGKQVKDFVGPKAERISPTDIVFNPLAKNFRDGFKIVRSMKTIGELKKAAMIDNNMAFWEKALQRRQMIQKSIGGYSIDDFNKVQAYDAQGLGNLYEYYMGNSVEVLEFYGDFHDPHTGELSTDRMITIVDRSLMVRDEPIPTATGVAPIFSVGWREVPDSLWSMGPLDNLVGMQYLIDHIQNSKQDALDLAVNSPKKVIGDVESFDWGPNSIIHLSEGGDVQEMGDNLNSILISNNQIAELEARMELYAGAPREAMGIRTPGEKTATEVTATENRQSRIFQEKADKFEEQLSENVLNYMLELSVNGLNSSDTIATIDSDIGVQQFLSITAADIAANGIIRPIGARHFAQQAQELQGLIAIMSSPVAQIIAPHTSGINLSKYIDDVLSIKGYQIFRNNVAIEEQQETASLAQQSQEDLQLQTEVPSEEEFGVE